MLRAYEQIVFGNLVLCLLLFGRFIPLELNLRNVLQTERKVSYALLVKRLFHQLVEQHYFYASCQRKREHAIYAVANAQLFYVVKVLGLLLFAPLCRLTLGKLHFIQHA